MLFLFVYILNCMLQAEATINQQDSHTFFCQVSGNLLEVLKIWPRFILDSEVTPRDDHTSVTAPVEASTSRHMWTQHRPFILRSQCVSFSITSSTARPSWDLEAGDMTDFPFKTIDMGGVEQSHHQELIGPTVPFLITASLPQWPSGRGGGSKHKEVCQNECVNERWQLKKG